MAGAIASYVFSKIRNFGTWASDEAPVDLRNQSTSAEYFQTPSRSTRAISTSLTKGANLGSRLDIARHAAVDHGYQMPSTATSREESYEEEEDEGEDGDDEGWRVQDQLNLQLSEATPYELVDASVLPSIEADDGCDGCNLDVSSPTYLLSWRVNEMDQVTRAVLSKRSSEGDGAEPFVLLVAKTKASTAHRPQDINVAKKRKPSPIAMNHNSKRARRANDSKKVENRIDEEQSVVETKTTRRAAKHAKKAMKSTLWTENLHDDTYLKRAGKKDGKAGGRKI